MVFVTADSCRARLEKLTRLLVSAFPGSTVYQHTDLRRVSHDVMNNKVDAVLLEAETDKKSGLEFMEMLQRQKPNIPVFFISRTEGFGEEAEMAGASGCFLLPEREEQLLEALRLVQRREKVS